jgi:Cu/Ag efflux protein CusF
MYRTPHPRRPLAVAASAAVFALSAFSALPALAKAAGYAAEIAKIELPERRVTFKASMGQQTMRVAPRVVLTALHPGDKVRLTFGQKGSESVITRIELVKP